MAHLPQPQPQFGVPYTPHPRLYLGLRPGRRVPLRVHLFQRVLGEGGTLLPLPPKYRQGLNLAQTLEDCRCATRSHLLLSAKAHSGVSVCRHWYGGMLFPDYRNLEKVYVQPYYMVYTTSDPLAKLARRGGFKIRCPLRHPGSSPGGVTAGRDLKAGWTGSRLMSGRLIQGFDSSTAYQNLRCIRETDHLNASLWRPRHV